MVTDYPVRSRVPGREEPRPGQGGGQSG
jgi:hypothetical protein